MDPRARYCSGGGEQLKKLTQGLNIASSGLSTVGTAFILCFYAYRHRQRAALVDRLIFHLNVAGFLTACSIFIKAVMLALGSLPWRLCVGLGVAVDASFIGQTGWSACLACNLCLQLYAAGQTTAPSAAVVDRRERLIEILFLVLSYAVPFLLLFNVLLTGGGYARTPYGWCDPKDGLYWMGLPVCVYYVISIVMLGAAMIFLQRSLAMHGDSIPEPRRIKLQAARRFSVFLLPVRPLFTR